MRQEIRGNPPNPRYPRSILPRQGRKLYAWAKFSSLDNGSTFCDNTCSVGYGRFDTLDIFLYKVYNG